MELSCVSLTAPASDSKNDGQPVPLSNFADELKTAEPQPAHLKMPSLYSCSGPGEAQIENRPCHRTAEQGQAARWQGWATHSDNHTSKQAYYLVQGAGEGQLSARLPQHPVLCGREQLMPLLVTVANRSLGPYDLCGYQTTFATRCANSAMQDGMSSDPDFSLRSSSSKAAGSRRRSPPLPRLSCSPARSQLPPLLRGSAAHAAAALDCVPPLPSVWTLHTSVSPVHETCKFIACCTFSDKQNGVLGPTHQASLPDMHTSGAPGDATARSLSLLTRNRRVFEAAAEMTVVPGLLLVHGSASACRG